MFCAHALLSSQENVFPWWIICKWGKFTSCIYCKPTSNSFPLFVCGDMVRNRGNSLPIFPRKKDLFFNLKAYCSPFSRTFAGNPDFSDAYTGFHSFLPCFCKLSVNHTLVCICFRICSGNTKFHSDFDLLIDIFEINC